MPFHQHAHSGTEHDQGRLWSKESRRGLSQEEENENEKIHHHDRGNEIRPRNENATFENDVHDAEARWQMGDNLLFGGIANPTPLSGHHHLPRSILTAQSHISLYVYIFKNYLSESTLETCVDGCIYRKRSLYQLQDEGGNTIFLTSLKGR